MLAKWKCSLSTRRLANPVLSARAQASCIVSTPQRPGWHSIQDLWTCSEQQYSAATARAASPLCHHQVGANLTMPSLVSEWDSNQILTRAKNGEKDVVSPASPLLLCTLFCASPWQVRISLVYVWNLNHCKNTTRQRKTMTAWDISVSNRQGKEAASEEKVSGDAEASVDFSNTFITLPLAVAGLNCVNSSGKEQSFSLKYLQCFLARGVQLSLRFFGEKHKLQL